MSEQTIDGFRVESDDFADRMRELPADLPNGKVVDMGEAASNMVDLPRDVQSPIAVLDASGYPVPVEAGAPILVGARYLFSAVEVRQAIEARHAAHARKMQSQMTILVDGPATLASPPTMAAAQAAAPAQARAQTLEHALMMRHVNRADGSPSTLIAP